MYLIQKFKRIFSIQKQRYKRKGILNTCLGFTLLFGIMATALKMGEKIWPQNIDDKQFFIFIWSFLIHTITGLLSFSIYLPGYIGRFSIYQKYAINKSSLWPWQRPNWGLIIRKTIFNLILNQLWIFPLLTFIGSNAPIKLRFNNLPALWELFSQVLIVYFTEDFFFYWAHRLFHSSKYLYKMHKIHHQYDKIYSYATQYFHPVDYVIGNVLPSSIGFMILGNRAHCFTYFFWIFWKVMISTEGHSGFEFPWSPMRVLPLVTGPSYHDHHHSHNVGNYAGSCYFWDVMLQTSQPYFKQFLKGKKQ